MNIIVLHQQTVLLASSYLTYISLGLAWLKSPLICSLPLCFLSRLACNYIQNCDFLELGFSPSWISFYIDRSSLPALVIFFLFLYPRTLCLFSLSLAPFLSLIEYLCCSFLKRKIWVSSAVANRLSHLLAKPASPTFSRLGLSWACNITNSPLFSILSDWLVFLPFLFDSTWRLFCVCTVQSARSHRLLLFSLLSVSLRWCYHF